MDKDNFINTYFPSLVYAIGITLGINAALEELHKKQNFTLFLVLSISILLILILEIVINFLVKNKKVEIDLDFDNEINEAAEFFNKVLLPVFLFISIIGFGFYNLDSALLNISTGIIFICFFVLFINIRAFFQNNLTLESKTHFVYDFFKLLIFFFSANTLSYLYKELPFINGVLFILMVGISFILLALMVWRIQIFGRQLLVSTFIVSLFIGIAYSALNRFLTINPFQVSLALVFLFYIIIAIIQHKLTNTLKRDVIVEYSLVILIAIAILLGLS